MWRGMWSEAEPQDLEENSHQKTTTMLKVVESTDLVQFRDITLDKTASLITLYSQLFRTKYLKLELIFSIFGSLQSNQAASSH